MAAKRSPVAFTLAALAIVAACGGSGGSDDAADSTRPPRRSTTTDAAATSDAGGTPAPTSVAAPTTTAAAEGMILADGTVDEAQFEASAAAFAALPEDEQRRQLADLDRSVERQMWTLSGMDDALGGTAAADAVFEGLYAAFAAQVDASAEQPIVLAGWRSAPDVNDAFGAGLFGSLVLQSLTGKSAVRATNDGTTGTDSQNGLTVTATADHLTVGFTGSTTYGGAELALTTSTDFAVCPDANGLVEVHSTSDVRASAGSAAGIQAKVEVHSLIQLDDNAAVADNKYSRHIEYTKTTGGSRQIMDITTGLDGSNTLTFGSWFGSAKFFQETFALGSFLGLMVHIFNVDAAKAAWESGRCINLQTAVSAGPTGLPPNASVTITAQPRVKSDGSPAGGTVTALLTGGEAAVDPSSTPLPADAEFTYTAPSERDKTGQVSLESRSKRGVGKATIDFDTKAKPAFAADGGGGEWFASGTICSLEAPFTLSGMGLTVEATPAGAEGGSYTLSGNAGGAEWEGGGSYTVALAADGASGVLAITGSNTVLSPLGSFSDSAEANFVLTKIDPCPA